jgi:hypothetical protein
MTSADLVAIFAIRFGLSSLRHWQSVPGERERGWFVSDLLPVNTVDMPERSNSRRLTVLCNVETTLEADVKVACPAPPPFPGSGRRAKNLLDTDVIFQASSRRSQVTSEDVV